MRILFLFFIFLTNLFSVDIISKDTESFSSPYEYGKMLYNNPRDIGCHKCHANEAEGMQISSFKHIVTMRLEDKNITKSYDCVIQTKSLENISLLALSNKLNNKTKKPKFKKIEVCNRLLYGHIMPKYIFTKREILAIYAFITKDY